MENQTNKLTVLDIAKMIDHSLLRPDIAQDELLAGIELAREYNVASVCVRPCDVQVSAEKLAGTDVLVGTVIAFPHGTNLTEVKVFEAQKAMDQGAVELDMVLSIGRLKSGDFDVVEGDIRAVVEAAHAGSAIVKVILENSYLTNDEIIKACQICEQAGADYVKTSTGYAPSGAKLEDVKLMRQSCSPQVAVKAAGGIRTLDDVLEYRAAGTKRIGTRSTQAILEEAAERDKARTLEEIQ
jgi:deoxyribose-phosphate aldolase